MLLLVLFQAGFPQADIDVLSTPPQINHFATAVATIQKQQHGYRT